MPYQQKSGLSTTAAYQVSGAPFASGSIDSTGGPTMVQFPRVTRWITVQNHDVANDLFCAFSENALPSNGGTNHFMLADAASNAYWSMPRLEIKVTEMWFEGSDDFDVIAGLTGISNSEIQNNWSGSLGVG
jgi:hypothetical protein